MLVNNFNSVNKKKTSLLAKENLFSVFHLGHGEKHI